MKFAFLSLLIFIVFAVLLVILLYLPVRYYVRREIKEEIKTKKKSKLNTVKVTKAGFIVFGILVFFLFALKAVGELAPETYLGKLINRDNGEGIFEFLLILIFAGIAKFLEMKGIHLLEKNKYSDDKS